MDNPKDYRSSNRLIEEVLWFFNKWIKAFFLSVCSGLFLFFECWYLKGRYGYLMKSLKEGQKKGLLIQKAFCASGRIWTLNPQSRNLVFYPVELRMHYYKIQCKYSCTSMNRSTSWSILIGPFSDRYPSLFQYSLKVGSSDLLTI